MSKKTKTIISLIINSIIALSAIFVIFEGIFFAKESRDLSVKGLNYLRYFTNLSGLLAGISSLIVATFNIKSLKDNSVNPKWVEKLHLVASTAVMITFITVVVFLAPSFSKTSGYFSLFVQDMFHMHFFNCILSFISFILFNTDHKMNAKDAILGSIAVPIYSLVYMPLVLTNVWPDFYGFTFGGKMYLIPLVIVIMYGASYLVSIIASSIHNKAK